MKYENIYKAKDIVDKIDKIVSDLRELGGSNTTVQVLHFNKYVFKIDLFEGDHRFNNLAKNFVDDMISALEEEKRLLIEELELL
jgi:hypothetical protein